MDLGKYLPPLIAAEQLPQVLGHLPALLLLAGQVVLKVSERPVPGLLACFLQVGNLFELLQLLSVLSRFGGHPGRL